MGLNKICSVIDYMLEIMFLIYYLLFNSNYECKLILSFFLIVKKYCYFELNLI